MAFYGIYRYSDVNLGWGFDGWVTFTKASNENEAIKKTTGNFMEHGARKLSKRKLMEIRKEYIDSIRKGEQILAILEKMT